MHTKIRRKKPSKAQRFAIVDCVLLVVFVPLYFEDSTGLSNHQYLGAVFGVGVLVHVAQHAKWVLRVTRNFFRRPPKRSRTDYIINLLMFGSLIVCIGSGLLVSTWLRGLVTFPTESAYYGMLGIHDISGWVVLSLIVVHLVRHRKWIGTMMRKHMRPKTPAQQLRPTPSAPVGSSV